jgi:anti-sigma factor RsiW
MTSDVRPDAVQDWLLERYRLGELPDAERRQVQDALARDADLRERLDDLELSTTALLREHPPAQAVAAVRERAARERPATPVLHGWTPLAAAAVVTASLVGLAVWGPWTGVPPEADVTRVKGITPYLLLYRKAASEVERLPPAAVARPHDVVQLAYQAGARRYGVIVSVDGRGVVTRHLPEHGTEAAPLLAGRPVALSQSYELDDAPGFERFLLVAADEPFAVTAVEEAVRRLHASLGAAANERRLDLPDSMDQFSLVVKKESSR